MEIMSVLRCFATRFNYLVICFVVLDTPHSLFILVVSSKVDLMTLQGIHVCLSVCLSVSVYLFVFISLSHKLKPLVVMTVLW